MAPLCGYLHMAKKKPLPNPDLISFVAASLPIPLPLKTPLHQDRQPINCASSGSCLMSTKGSILMSGGAPSWAKRELAHLPLHPTKVVTRSARHDALLENLPQDSLMECIPLLRGGLPRSSRFSVEPREQREEMIACPGLHLLLEQLHASSLGWRNAPSSGHRTPVVPSRGSYCATLFWNHANGS